MPSAVVVSIAMPDRWRIVELGALSIQRAPLRDLRGVRWMPKQVVREIARIAGWLRAAIQRE
jgi:hypothetical protein